MATILDQIVGHQAIQQRLFSALLENRLPSTFLFVGPSGVGKKAIAFALSQALLCAGRKPTGHACGICNACQRTQRAFQNKENTEGLFFVAPEKTQIKIEQARQILDFLSLRSITPARTIVIDAAETLNQQAANALLKILEEPPEKTYFFLIAPTAQHVLTTIRSRSQIISFSPLSVEQMKRKTQAPDWAVKASQGSFEKLNFLQDADELLARQNAVEFLKIKMIQAKGYLLPEWREMVRGRSEALQLARHLALLLRDAVYVQLGQQQNLFNQDQIKVLQDFVHFMQPDRLQTWAQKALQLENSLLANRDSQLVFEEFWLS